MNTTFLPVLRAGHLSAEGFKECATAAAAESDVRGPDLGRDMICSHECRGRALTISPLFVDWRDR